MRDLTNEEVTNVYGAGGKSCGNPCGGGHGTNMHGTNRGGTRNKCGTGRRGGTQHRTKGRCN